MIDSGSTHNFIDPIIIRCANIPTHSDAIFEVMVVNGERLKGNGICKNIVIQSQGVPILDLFLLSSEGCDAVLRAHLLRTLGLVLWDFATLSMSLKQQGKEYHVI